MTVQDQSAFADALRLAPHSFAPPAPRDHEWLIPSALMTFGLGLAALLLMPIAGYTSIPPYFERFVNWMIWAFTGGLFLLTLQVMRLRRAGETAPISAIRAQLAAARATTLAAIAGVTLAGVDMFFFMWIKPEVTAVAPFWADELFADMDKAIFGRDPWRFFQGIDLTFHAWAYSFFWIFAIMGTLVWLFSRKASAERSAAILSYFTIWSLFGPLGQYFGSAAGPIFYQKAGLGDRFAELSTNIPPVTNAVSGYLWKMHAGGELGVGAGISAMPSLHIATVTWIYLSFRGAGSRVAPLAALFGLYIFALSVALGWHYAVDGFAGAAGALLCHQAARAWIGRRSARTAEPAPAL